MKRRRVNVHRWSTTDFSAVLITLAAPALGGSTQLWAQTLLVAGAALLMLLDPPRRPLPRPLLAAAWGLLALGLVAFLPAAWFSAWPGREHLITELKVPLANTLTLQPWVTCEWFALLAASVAWAAYLVSREWTMARTELLRIYITGLAALVGLALILYLRGVRVPLWTPLAGVPGFFPNRNQMGNVLALAGIVSLALVFRALRRKDDSRYLWIGVYLVFLIALVVNCSRAGYGLFFGGSIVWLFWANWREKRSHTPLLGAAAVMALLLGTLLVGGDTVERFLQPLASKEARTEGRLEIFEDALPLLRDASWHGVGLGNFDPLFAGYRRASRAENRAIHPESDWFWWGIELGWLAPLIILFAIGWWLWRHWPDPGRPGYGVSVALALAVILFALHGVVDVSGHRLGSLWPALWLGSLLADRRAGTVVPGRRRQIWRAPGLALLLLAGGWAVCLAGRNLWPTSAAFQRARAKMAQVTRMDGLEQVITEATAGLRYAPLHWQLYFYRAKAALLLGRPLIDVRYDFARAKFLEPNLSSVPFEEGQLWLLRAPQYALGPWRETLERAPTAARAGYFERMLRLTADLPEIRAEVPPLAQGHPELLLAYLDSASPVEFAIEVERQLLQFPRLESLSPAQRQKLFSIWARKGDLNKLLTLIEGNADWLPDAWQGYAKALARTGRFQEACETLARFCEQPLLPEVSLAAGESELATRLKRNPGDFVAGYALYGLRLKADDVAGALSVLAGLTTQAGCPAYFFFLQARLEMQAQRWPEAWKSWDRFLTLAPPAETGRMG